MDTVYNEKTEYKIKKEFERLKDLCYLDHAGATLYSEEQVRNYSQELCSSVFGNPHSLSLNSKYSTDAIDEVRSRILKHFHTNSSKYTCIFTSGATAAIRLLIENFDWNYECEEEGEEYFDTVTTLPNIESKQSAYVYTQSNHTSIVGGREIAAQRGVEFYCLGYEESFSIFEKDVKKSKKTYYGNSLFAYPAQCNFSGKKYPLEWIAKAQNGALDSHGMSNGENRKTNWFVLLDAATYCSTNDLDLSVFSPDFVCLSFYKIFGFPTGLGALLVRNSAAHLLKKTYFGGGTVEISLPGLKFHKFRKNLYERFEDGTISFLSIVALNHGLRTLERLNLNMRLISQHVFNIAKYAYYRMKALRHYNGTRLVEFYADSDYTNITEQGGIVNFNLLRSDERYIGFTEVLHVANLHNVQFRTGCFCNSGACQRHLKMTDYDMKIHYEAGHVCGDAMDIINGRPTGAIRISFGYMTTSDNIDKFIKMLKDSFLESRPPAISPYIKDNFEESSKIILKKIWAYPIKSCGAMEVNNWKLNDKGLEYDREWMIVTENGVCLTQKQEPKMCMILPKIDIGKDTMTLEFRNANDPITIPLHINESKDNEYDVCESKVCGDRILGYDCGDDVAEWLSHHLNAPGLRLIKQSTEDQRKSKSSKNSENGLEGKLSLSNQAQYLLINSRSIHWLQNQIEPGEDINLDTFEHRFRGNFLVDGAIEFSESNWTHLQIGAVKFKVNGPCARCQMICIDQYTGEKNRKPLVTLSRVLNGKIKFGIYLSHERITNNTSISVDDEIFIRNDILDI